MTTCRRRVLSPLSPDAQPTSAHSYTEPGGNAVVANLRPWHGTCTQPASTSPTTTNESNWSAAAHHQPSSRCCCAAADLLHESEARRSRHHVVGCSPLLKCGVAQCVHEPAIWVRRLVMQTRAVGCCLRIVFAPFLATNTPTDCRCNVSSHEPGDSDFGSFRFTWGSQINERRENTLH